MSNMPDVTKRKVSLQIPIKTILKMDNMAAALREGFVDPHEYKWRRQSKAKEAADWVANFLPYAACLAIGLALGHLLFPCGRF